MSRTYYPEMDPFRAALINRTPLTRCYGVLRDCLSAPASRLRSHHWQPPRTAARTCPMLIEVRTHSSWMGMAVLPCFTSAASSGGQSGSAFGVSRCSRGAAANYNIQPQSPRLTHSQQHTRLQSSPVPGMSLWASSGCSQILARWMHFLTTLGGVVPALVPAGLWRGSGSCSGCDGRNFFLFFGFSARMALTDISGGDLLLQLLLHRYHLYQLAGHCTDSCASSSLRQFLALPGFRIYMQG